MDPAAAIELAARSGLAAVEEAAAGGDSDIQRFYGGAVVFVTGGTGFMGKQLAEKLLRSCKICKLYLLMRPKRGKSIEQRLADMLKEPVFDYLRNQQPDFTQKIVPIHGDVAEIRLGMTDEDWKNITKQADVIFHVAATTRFDESLRVATLINVRGTREVLLLGKECKKLGSFVHVSTAYTHATSNLIGREVSEQFYPSPIAPEALISMAESVKNDRLLSITPMLIKDWPNTYSFTKAVAEELVRSMSDGLPICIVRPGIVLSSYREPSPGWLDETCMYGVSGLLFGIGMGVIHTALMDTKDVKSGLIPCDYVNNAIIAAGRETANIQNKGGNSTRIYTVSGQTRNPITFGELERTFNNEGRKNPTQMSIYYNCVIFTKYKILFTIYSLIFHVIPAYMADFVCLLVGKERRFAKLTKKVYNMCISLSYFMTNDWNFTDNNLEKLYTSLSARDKTIFNFDVTTIDWTEFIVLWCIGTRKYLLKDGLQDTQYAVRKQYWLRIVHYVVFPLYLFGIWKAMCLAFFVVSSVISLIIGLVF